MKTQVQIRKNREKKKKKTTNPRALYYKMNISEWGFIFQTSSDNQEFEIHVWYNLSRQQDIATLSIRYSVPITVKRHLRSLSLLPFCSSAKSSNWHTTGLKTFFQKTMHFIKNVLFILNIYKILTAFIKICNIPLSQRGHSFLYTESTI